MPELLTFVETNVFTKRMSALGLSERVKAMKDETQANTDFTADLSLEGDNVLLQSIKAGQIANVG